ncbi:MAG: DUF3261 domain-containing protein [Gammaproteobacteria bacterium]|nr:DUF3261 domain-containing protein [Gammaproteobacteria bacterium]
MSGTVLYRLCPVALLAFMLAGCVSAPGPQCVRLAYDGWFCLLAPAALPAHEDTSLVSVSQNGTQKHFVGQLSITQNKMTLALFNLAGLPAATLHWDGQKATLRSPKKLAIEPKQLVALLELSLAAPETLRRALHGLTLSTAYTESGEERRLSDGSDLVARAVMNATGVTHIEVPGMQLEIMLTPLKSNTDE